MNNRHIEALTSAMRQQAAIGQNSRAKTKLCLISSYDASLHSVKVMRQPQNTESNWMPLGAIGIGNGWGIAVGPQIGDQVMVQYEGDDPDGGVITARIFSTAQQAIAVPSGEVWMVHSTSSSLKLTNDGKMAVTSQSDTNITVGGNANIVATGNVSVSAKIASVVASVSAAITAPIIKLGATGQTLLQLVTSAFEALFNGHEHTSEAPGTPTSTPIQQMDSSHLTSTITGG